MAVDIDLNRLQIFRDVVLAGSFSKAALQLKQPKSRISRNISALETELGVQLIYRTTRQFQLTQAGTELFDKASPLIGELRSTLEQVSSQSDEIAGLIKVTVPEDIGIELMGRLCHEFQTLYPKIRVSIHSGNQYVDLVKESLDVAVRIGKSRDSSMIQKKIGLVDMATIVSPSLLKRMGEISRLEELERVPYLAFAELTSQRHSLRVSNGKETRVLKLTSTFASNNFFILRAMAIEGMGFARVPAFIVREAINDGSLVQVFKEWKSENSPIQILIPHQKEVPERIRRFIDFMTQRLAQYVGI